MKVVLVYCKSCKRKHRMTLQPCPKCGEDGGCILMPSGKVYDNCKASYHCDGCEAYMEHTNPY
jgi:hypothetical protein